MKVVSRKVILPFLGIFIVLLILEFLIICQIAYRNRKTEILYKDISNPINTIHEDKIYFSVDSDGQWTDKDNKNNTVYDCYLENNNKYDFRNWFITIALPENTKIKTSWNCNCEISDNTLTINGKSHSNRVLRGKSNSSFGFILESENDISTKYAKIGGIYYYKLVKNPYFMPIFVLIIIEILIFITVVIVRLTTLVQMQNLKNQKKRDDALIEQTIKTFVNFIDTKDEYTRGHSARVGKYTQAIAKQMGFNKQEQKDLYYMGLMHDIGKLSIPDEILNKTSKLSSEEWQIIQLHTSNGVKMLRDFSIMPKLKDAVLYHHERYDGKGYVNQLKGEEIPLEARIICVADSFDAMNTNRCYRLKFSKERIISELERCAGKQFDPKVVIAMVELIKNGTIDKL